MSRRQQARVRRRAGLWQERLNALALARTPEERFRAELDLFRLLVEWLPAGDRDGRLTEAADALRRQREITERGFHMRSSPDGFTPPGASRAPQTGARAHARGTQLNTASPTVTGR